MQSPPPMSFAAALSQDVRRPGPILTVQMGNPKRSIQGMLGLLDCTGIISPVGDPSCSRQVEPFDFTDRDAMARVESEAIIRTKAKRDRQTTSSGNFWSWDALVASSSRVHNYTNDGQLVRPSWRANLPVSGGDQETSAMYSAAMARTAIESKLRGEATGGWLHTSFSAPGPAPDTVIHVAPKFVSPSGSFQSTKIFAHSKVLLRVDHPPGPRWGLSLLQERDETSTNTVKYEATIEASNRAILQAVRFAYTGSPAQTTLVQSSDTILVEDCGSLLTFAASIGYRDLCVLILSTPPAAPTSVLLGGVDEIAEGIFFLMARTMAIHEGGLHTNSSGRAEIYANVATSFCSAYDKVLTVEGRGGASLAILTACLRGMPLYVAKHIMNNCADFYTIQGQFLEAWSAANYNEIAHQAGAVGSGEIRDEIVSMVGNLQLPDWYIRHMLGGGSAIASVCAGTPKGETFLQEKFRLLEISDSSSGLRGGLGSYVIRIGESTTGFSEQLMPNSVIDYCMGGRLVGGVGCIMACCGSSPVYFHLDKSSVNLCLDDYGAGAYVVPVWGAQQSHPTILTYAVIRYDPMVCIARNQHSHTNSSISDSQVCVVLSSQCHGSAGDPNVLDSWDLSNSEAFAPGMTMWGGVYLPFQAMIGWNPVGMAIDAGIVGDLYIVSPYRVGHAAVKGVCLSHDGCYCVLELDNIPTVLCFGPSGNVMRVSLLGNDSASDDDMDNNERIEASPISVCSVECADGEFAALYSDCVRVYHARNNGTLLLCCTVVVKFGGIASKNPCAMIASCPISGDIYALDSALRVYVLERMRVDRAEVLHRFFEGDSATVRANPELVDRWAKVVGSPPPTQGGSSSRQCRRIDL